MSLRSRMFVAVSFTCSVGCVSHGRVRSGVSVSEWGVLSTGSSLASISLSVVSGRVVWEVRLSVVSERSVGPWGCRAWCQGYRCHISGTRLGHRVDSSPRRGLVGGCGASGRWF